MTTQIELADPAFVSKMPEGAKILERCYGVVGGSSGNGISLVSLIKNNGDVYVREVQTDLLRRCGISRNVSPIFEYQIAMVKSGIRCVCPQPIKNRKMIDEIRELLARGTNSE